MRLSADSQTWRSYGRQLTDLMTKRIAMIDERMKSIMDKGEESLTPQDYADLRSLTKQKEEIQRTYGERLNAQTQEQVIQNAFDDTKLKPMDISEALNRITGRSIDKDQYSIIADAHDPSKIIRCHGYEEQDPETGKPYIKTGMKSTMQTSVC